MSLLHLIFFERNDFINEKVRAEYAKLLKESAEAKSEIKFHEDKIKALEAKEKLLTKKGRNQFIFSLGLRAEEYFKEPEFLTDYDFDMIFTAAFAYKKPEVYYSEILLPPNAPKEYLDRETLWNSAESVEKSWNSQLARNIVAALPKEIPREQLPEMVRKFCNEQFVSKGMCCDFSIHDKGDGNPHVHILLSLRAIDENGKWMPKCRKEYDLDDYGNRIILPRGEYKSHRVDTTDWNKKENSEIWRDAWAKIQNDR